MKTINYGIMQVQTDEGFMKTPTKEQDIKNLENKVANSMAYILQAEKQYANSLIKLERQKKAIEQARADIDRVKIHIANRLVELQKLKDAEIKRSAEQSQQEQL